MYLGDYLGFSPEPWSWMIPLVLAITFFMTLVTCSLWFLKQIRIALGAPISLGNHARTQQANEERSSPVDLNKALESRILDALPTSRFEGEHKEDELVGSQKECAICLGEFEAGEWLRRIPSCDHTFHMACIDTWFRSHSTCPVCRSDVCCSGESKEC